jgi:lipopolysaccharide export system permease protein
MVFVWQFINDMVGKGVDMIVLAKLFFYASLSSTPNALPLAVLLASLMTFGNLGEHMELTAMKASGISLIKIMKPIVFVVIIICGISFVFQNNIIPVVQTKTFTILTSLRQKSPELQIPEGSFYKEITGYNVYVRHKDKKTGMLKNMMIYDYSKGFENAVVIVADSGKLSSSNDKKYLILTLYDGESFQNLGTRKTRNINERVPYQRETFKLRDILIAFDTNFNMADESIMGNRDSGKNVKELISYIDSVAAKTDSVNRQYLPQFKQKAYENSFKSTYRYSDRKENIEVDSIFKQSSQAYYNSLDLTTKIDYLLMSKSRAEQIKLDNNIEMFRQNEMNSSLRAHKIQLQNKFSLALSCLLFFFIGAPLGSIIRKGGLGMPTVLSVFIYLTYYITHNLGMKMARQGVWMVEEGVWLSTVLLIALGAFVTYKAVNDSSIMNPDVWKNFIQKLTGKKDVRVYTKKEVIMDTPDYSHDINEMKKWNKELDIYLDNRKKNLSYFNFWKEEANDNSVNQFVQSMNEWIDDLLNSDENLIIGKLMDYPVIQTPRIAIPNNTLIKRLCLIVFPIGLIVYFWNMHQRKQMKRDLITSKKVNENLIMELENLKEKKKCYGI